MLIYNVSFQVTDGLIVAALRDTLTDAGWADGLAVHRKRPNKMTRRVVTLRNDGGPTVGVRGVRRHGVNLWADDPVDCECMALDAQRGLRVRLPGLGSITATGAYTLPIEIEDEPAYTVGTTDLAHFYFAFDATVRGVGV